MSETAEDREFYSAAEAAFIGRRGTPFLLSPRDFALLKEWRALGIPLEAIVAGIDQAFSRREERGAIGRVNSLSYCRDAVLSAWERRAEAAAGRGTGRGAKELDPQPALSALGQALESVAARRPDLVDPLESTVKSLGRLAGSGKTAEEVEASLVRMDKKLAALLYAALPEAERAEIDRRVESSMEAARSRMDEATTAKTARALTRRAVRERLELPRLTLL